MRELMDDPRTGLRDSSDTNKTRMALLGLLDEVYAEAYELGKKEFNDCTCQEKWTLGVVHRKDGPCYWPDRSASNPKDHE